MSRYMAVSWHRDISFDTDIETLVLTIFIEVSKVLHNTNANREPDISTLGLSSADVTPSDI